MKDSGSAAGTGQWRRAIELPAEWAGDQGYVLVLGFFDGKRLSEVVETSKRTVIATKVIQHRTLASWTWLSGEWRGP